MTRITSVFGIVLLCSVLTSPVDAKCLVIGGHPQTTRQNGELNRFSSSQSPKNPGRLPEDNLTSSKRAFQLPVFPGTEPFPGSPHLALLQPPTATIMKVYKTGDGRSLDKEMVISFFRNQLAGKGWTDGISKRHGDEPYLNMRIDLGEFLADKTEIRCSGDLHLWVAARDGMYTVLLKQWRISSSDQDTRSSVYNITTALDKIGVRIGYRVLKVHEDSWESDYENEYLIDRHRYVLISRTRGSRSDLDPNGLIELTVLTYRDVKTAADESQAKTGGGSDGSSGNKVLTLPFFDPKIVIVKKKIVVLIRDIARNQKSAVEDLVSDIEKVW